MTLDCSKYLESLNKIKFSLEQLVQKTDLPTAISKIACSSGVPVLAIIVYCAHLYPDRITYLNNRFKALKAFYGYTEVIGLDGKIITELL